LLLLLLLLVLCGLDAWGTTKLRHGGGSSLVCEFVRFMTVVQYLDTPAPRVSRLVYRNSDPYNFPGPDHTPPTRDRMDPEVKAYGMFNPKH
jgi:hypothetical protein